MGSDQTKQSNHSRYLRALLFCVACVAINAVGGMLAINLSLPVYLDSLGTVLASMLGSYVPGIAVGYVTNVVNNALDSSSMYYGIVNVLIALCVSWMARRRWFDRLSRTLLASFVLALACTVTSAGLSYYLNGGTLSNELSDPLARQLQLVAQMPALTAQILSLLFVNVIDKTLVVLLATLIYHALPQTFVTRFDFAPWQQRPLSSKEYASAMSTTQRKLSLATKFIIIVTLIVSAVGLATTGFSYLAFHQSTIDLEVNKAKGITALMAQSVDPTKVNEYLAKGDDAPGFAEAEARLAEIRDSFDNVQYAYVYQIRSDGCHVVLDPDTADEPGSDPGSVVEFDEAFAPMLPTLLAGGEIEPVISNETYGWLLTVYTPLKNDAGETVCYVCADLSMGRLLSNEKSFVVGILALFAAFFILIVAIILWLTRYGIVLPINTIARTSSKFVLSERGVSKESLDAIESLDIHTGDEIENLYDSVSQMSASVLTHIAEAEEKNEAIARMQSNLIMVLADLVESRDKHTGDHIRNTALYTRIIMNQMRREGILADVLTNEFISNVYQSAPLHDIGKISVPDAILNKPGRLTNEEFEIMKGHTLAGQEILRNAKGAVAESSYLDEAERLAAFHHEKWNGTGYPYGLSGEEIPLSARIMAVADVFDALVSKRSYKAGFPVEKAFAIIEEGIGSHFDPQVARAFLHAQDKARAVVEESKRRQAEEEAARAAAEAARSEEAAKNPLQPGEHVHNDNPALPKKADKNEPDESTSADDAKTAPKDNDRTSAESPKGAE